MLDRIVAALAVGVFAVFYGNQPKRNHKRPRRPADIGTDE